MIELKKSISKMVNKELFRVIEKKNPSCFELRLREDGCWTLFMNGFIPISFTVGKKREKVLVIKKLTAEDKIILSGAIEKVKQELRRILENYYLP